MATKCAHCGHNIVNLPAGMIVCPNPECKLPLGADLMCPTCKRPFESKPATKVEGDGTAPSNVESSSFVGAGDIF